MSTQMPFLAVDKPGTEGQSWIDQQWTSAGFHIVQTFDLQVARLAHSDCTCPYHGTANCDCQLTVLLVYLQAEEPSSLVLHSRDGRTEVSFGRPVTRQVDVNKEQLLERLILSRLPSIPTPTEADCDARSAD